ncbi:PAS domain S-box protein [Methylomagnum ishizawai]|uniref:PAS domain S-box protein n=1 Tax=Methylomagnum ishizawai TaxID=1760988 RepID=UPI00159415EA|nr:PAS domain S-box protein [Methylomagnum ishizawai]
MKQKGALWRWRAHRYIQATWVTLGLAAVLGLVEPFFGDIPPVSPFLLGVMFATWQGGFRVGLFATLLSVLAHWLFFHPSVRFPAILDAYEGPRILMLLVMGGALSRAIAHLRTAERRALALSLRQARRLERELAERGRVAEALRQSEERYRAVVEDQTEVIARFTPDGTLTFVNEVYCRFFGKSYGELVGHKWHPRVVAEDVALIEAELATLSIVQPVVAIENRVYSGAGRIHWMQFINRGLFDAEGGLLGVQCVGRDITGLKQAEAELRESQERLTLALEAAEMGVWSWDVVTDAVYWSPECFRIYGYPEFDGTAAAFGRLLHPDDAGAVWRAVERALAGIDGYAVEFRAIRPDGRVVWLSKRAQIGRDPEGRPLRMVGTVQDITRRKEVEAERESLQRQLQQAQHMEAIGRLTGGIAHDFNNILASILGYTGLALDRHVPDPHGKLAEYLRQIKTAGERARDLVAKMLAYSRDGEARALPPLAPGPLVAEVIGMLESVMPPGVEVRADLDPAVPDILIEPVDFHQVLTNLALNARDAIGEAGRIDIVLRRVAVDAGCAACHRRVRGGFVELSVADSGTGIEDGVLPRIFEPFFTTKPLGKGTGMGLPVVLGIVHHAGGHILVESPPGTGAVFRLLFPPVSGEDRGLSDTT